MNNDKQTSGPAFGAHPESKDWHPSWQGMTLRDYFAAKAMQGLLAADVQVINGLVEKTKGSGSISELSYYMADAMLEARK